MLNIAICDDLPNEISLIRAAAEEYFKQHTDEQMKIHIYDNPLLFLESIEKNGGFDILLLDICMPGITGTQVGAEVRKRKDKSEIIFITTSDEFAVDAFALKAAHYLIKPFTQTQFNEAMDRAMTGFAKEKSKKVPLKLSGGGIKTVDLNEIFYIESSDHLLYVHLKDDETLEVRESLSGLLGQMEALSPGQFLSPYKGYLANLKAVRTVEPDGITLHSGRTLPIVRRSYRELLERYFSYTFGGNCP